MALEMLERTSEETNNPDRRITGVAVGQVLDNTDVLTMGRVQIQLPWLDMPLWARVAVLMAGPNRGTFFIPQPGDEVLVAFNHGDIQDDEEQVIKIDKDGITIKTKKKDEKKEREVILNKDGITLKVKKGDLILKVEDEGKLQLEAERIEIKAKSDCAIKGHPIRL